MFQSFPVDKLSLTHLSEKALDPLDPVERSQKCKWQELHGLSGNATGHKMTELADSDCLTCFSS